MNAAISLNPSEKILNAAYTCISNKGYANISMRQIAKEAGVALSQLHYYFGSKKDLFNAIGNKLKKQYVDEFKKQLQSGNSSSESFNSLLIYFQNNINSSPNLVRILHDLTGLALWSSTFRNLLNNLYEELSELIEEYVLSSYSSNEFDNKTISRLLLTSLMGMSVQAIISDKNEDETAHMLNSTKLLLK